MILLTIDERKSTYEGNKSDKIRVSGKAGSGKWLATQVGHTENTVSRWCSNKVQPSLDNLVKVAEVLEVDIRDLLRPTLKK